MTYARRKFKFYTLTPCCRRICVSIFANTFYCWKNIVLHDLNSSWRGEDWDLYISTPPTLRRPLSLISLWHLSPPSCSSGHQRQQQRKCPLYCSSLVWRSADKIVAFATNLCTVTPKYFADRQTATDVNSVTAHLQRDSLSTCCAMRRRKLAKKGTFQSFLSFLSSPYGVV